MKGFYRAACGLVGRVAAHLAVVCGGLQSVACAGSEARQGVSAAVFEHVHPVLIRNDANHFLEIVVTLESDHHVGLQGMEFALDGTDDLDNLEALALFATGERREFDHEQPVGPAVDPAKSVRFRFDRPLARGANVFWLSCRLRSTAKLDQRVGARCVGIDTSLGTIEPDAGAPRAHRIGIAMRRHNDDGVHTYRIPALAGTPSGSLLCVYDMRRRARRDLQEDIDIGLSRSTDGGQTWEPPLVIMDMGEYGGLPQEQNGCSDPGILVDRQTGEIFCFAVWMHGKPGKHQWTDDGSEPGFAIGTSAQILLTRSLDDGMTWSEPENLTRKLKKPEWWLLAPSPQQGLSLDDGTLVMPCQGRDDHGVPFATIMTSADHGATWEVRAPAFSGGNECQAALLAGGEIMLNMRNDHERFRAVFVTPDLGATWRPHATNRNTLIEPNCNGSLYRIDDQRAGDTGHVLLFANPHSKEARTHHTIQVSFDDGQTWPEACQLLLDEGRGAGYPSLTRVGPDHVGIVYEGSRADLVFEKISLDELLQTHSR